MTQFDVFIASLLYLWCLEHVDNLGAYKVYKSQKSIKPIFQR
jgi:hypothetical protein